MYPLLTLEASLFKINETILSHLMRHHITSLEVCCTQLFDIHYDEDL